MRSVVALVVDLLRHATRRFPGQLVALDPSRSGVALARSGVVLIDEPEAHIHPSWQQELGFWFTEHFPSFQFIVATHSPFICQAAAPGGLIRVRHLDAPVAAEVAGDELYRTVVNGAVDEAVLSELFGLERTTSERSERLRDELARLEARELLGQALSPADRTRIGTLRAQLPSSGLAEIDQARRRIRARS